VINPGESAISPMEDGISNTTLGTNNSSVICLNNHPPRILRFEARYISIPFTNIEEIPYDYFKTVKNKLASVFCECSLMIYWCSKKNYLAIKVITESRSTKAQRILIKTVQKLKNFTKRNDIYLC
jgi:hypothetical protein